MVQIRTPDQRLRVFVSSTLNELADERAAAKRAIQRLHLTPVMFELGARPYPPRDLYLAYLRQSDVFIAIYGSQYGWIAPGRQVSGLEDEYLAATHMPRLVYVASPAPDRDPRLTAMLDRVQQGGLSYRRFGRARDLVGIISDDLAVLLSERFATGEPSGAPPRAPSPTEPAAPAAPTSAAAPTPDTAPAPPPKHQVGRDEPGAANRFIGRRHELAELGGLITDPRVRLITLTGPGGIGKTRLAMQAAAAAAADFDVLAVAELDQVPPARPLLVSALASALGVPDTTGTTLLASVATYVGSRHVLLVLDGFEHMLDEAPLVAELIATTAQLAVLVTSREPLRLTGERVIDVPPLAVPAWSDGVETARRADAVQLFADRAVAAGATVRLDDGTLQTIIQICQRLDGLPLAIELAASRIRTLGLDELSHLLDRSLAVLTGGPRDLPPRQQTLRATIAWSDDLLDEAVRHLFARLGVFAGGFSLDAAQAVCADERVPDVLDGLSSLVDKALLHPDHTLPGQPRFSMLQVIQEYADDRLASLGERDRLREAHGAYYRQFAVDNERRLRAGDMRSAIEQHRADEANVAAALQWAIDTRNGDAAAQLGAAIWPLWFTLGRYTEGADAMQRVLDTDLGLTDDSRANVMLSLGMMTFEYGDYTRAAIVLGPAIDRYIQRGDARGEATASIALGVIAGLGHRGDGDAELVRAVQMFRQLDDRWGLAFALLALGTMHLIDHREPDAIAPLAEGTEIARAGREDTLLCNGLIGLSRAHMGQYDVDDARAPLGESLAVSIGLANRETTARSLDTFAALAEQNGDASQAATLLGAADGIRHSIGAEVWAVDRRGYAETAAHLRDRLGDETYERLSSAGAALGLDDVLERRSPRGVDPPPGHDDLSPPGRGSRA